MSAFPGRSSFNYRRQSAPDLERIVINGAAEATQVGPSSVVAGTAPNATLNYDVMLYSFWMLTANAGANFTVNLRGAQGVKLDDLLEVGQTITCALEVQCGATAYYMSALTIDGVAVTPKYQGGVAFSAGNASSWDLYAFTITKTAENTFFARVSQTQFK